MKLSYDTLLPALYRLHGGGYARVYDVHFEFSGRPTRRWRDPYLKWTVQTFEDKLLYLRSRYKYVATPQGWTFPRGCIAYVTRSGHAVFRTSEWFRKLPADLLFIQEFTGLERLRVDIPTLWLREVELPCLAGYFGEIGLSLSDRHAARLKELLARTPVERALRINHSISRRSWLRYYLVTGELTRAQYLVHRKRLAADLKSGRFVIRGRDGYYRGVN